MYERHPGDDLLPDDPRLKYKWDWSRLASMVSGTDTAKWTHFQVSKCRVGKWTLSATQWAGSDSAYYTAEIEYNRHTISTDKSLKRMLTRIDAQIRAEKLLIEWIAEEYELLLKGEK